MATQILTAERLRELFHYDPQTGVFTRLVVTRGCRVGDVAGGFNLEGYVVIQIDRMQYRAHRLAWLYVYGAWPRAEIDHIDGNPANNRFANLRDATHSENLQNQRKARRGTKSGLLGVHWRVEVRKWKAEIYVDGRTKHIGYFLTAQAAHDAYVSAKREFHPGCTI